MSDVETEAVKRLNERLGEDGFDGSVKFDIENEGVVRLDEAGAHAGDGVAACTVTATAETLRSMLDGELDPTTAFMTGKIKVDGDMSQAMKLAQVLG